MNPDTQELLHVAYRTASRIVRNRALAEEAGERAVHRLQLALLAGNAPEKPAAWIRTVARRSACAMLRSGWSRVLPIDDAGPVAEVAEARPGRPTADDLRAILGGALTARQREALDAALSCRTIRDAARTCGMQPRDFRRYLAAITARARKHLGGLREPGRRVALEPEPRAS